jgi:hypothetical protein
LETAPYQEEELLVRPFLEEIMQSQALRPGIRYTIAGFALASLATACGGSANPVSPSASSSGLSLVTASAATAQRARQDVPFKGRLEGVYAVSFPAALTLAVSGEGTGNGTQLGQFTFEYDERVDLSTGIGTGTYEFTAANGDTLIAEWTGLGFPTDDPNVISIVEHATITGGTGRFANASGSFTVERLFSFVTNSGGGSFAGTIQLQ